MTKKDLERRNKFLLLQLKVIHELITAKYSNRDEFMENVGVIEYYSDPDEIKERLQFIEEYNEAYNFYHKTMNIKEYE